MAKKFDKYGKYIGENRGNPPVMTAEELKKMVDDKKKLKKDT